MFDLKATIDFINAFLGSGWFLLLQILGGALSFAMAVFIIYLAHQNGNIERQIRHLWISWNKTPVPPRRMVKRWNGIRKKVATDNQGLWREAILEADFMLDQILRRLGYEGGNTEERLEDTRAIRFPSLDEAFKAHRVADFIAQDPSYPLSREVTETTIEIYRNIFRETGVIL